MADADKTKLGKELNELSKLIEDVTIPYKGAKEPAKSRPGGARKKSGGTAGSEQALVADQIKLETIRGENLAKEVELSRLKLELAKVESQQSSPIASSSYKPIWTSTPAPNDVDIPSLQQLRQQRSVGLSQGQSLKGIFLPSLYLFSTKGTATYEKLDIAEFVCGFLEMIKVSEVGVQKAFSDYLHLLMEKATHYQWPAVRHFHAAISNAVEQRRLTWEDFEVIRSKSNTHFSHADLHATINNSNSGYASQVARGQGRSREKKASYGMEQFLQVLLCYNGGKLQVPPFMPSVWQGPP